MNPRKARGQPVYLCDGGMLYTTEEEIAAALEAGDAVAADIWAYALKNQLKDGGKKALDAEREARSKAEQSAKDAQKKLDEATARLAKASDVDTPEWEKRIAELEAKLNSESEARSKADAKSAAAERTQKGIEKGLPMALAKRLTGASDEELDAEIDELLPLMGSNGPLPNPQQGLPSEGRGGTLTAGRALYESANPSK